MIIALFIIPNCRAKVEIKMITSRVDFIAAGTHLEADEKL